MPINSKAIQVVLEQWPHWGFAHPPRIVGELQQGLNHTVLHLVSQSKHYVLKVLSEPNSNTIAVQRWAADNALAPQVAYAAPCHNYFLMDYLEQDGISQLANNSDCALVDLASALTKLHLLNSPSALCGQRDFKLLEHCDSYLADIAGFASTGFKEIQVSDRAKEPLLINFQDEHLILLPILQQFVADTTPKVLCHNDLVTENCLFSKHGLRFIDWDYASLNNPWFDLAALIYYRGLSEDQARKLLTFYDPQFGKQYGMPIYWAALCAVVWLDVLWHRLREVSAESHCRVGELSDLATKWRDLAVFGAKFMQYARKPLD